MMKGSLNWVLVVLVAAGAVILFGLKARASMAVEAQAKEAVQQGALVVDVRSPDEFLARHVPGALNIPVQELRLRLGELGPKERAVVLYCHSGARSAQAKRILERAGFGQVIDVGPMPSW